MQNKTTNDMTEPKEILDAAQVKMDKIVAHLIDDLASVRAGRASTNLLNGITVDYYGTPTPVSQVASVTVPDARTVLVQPWEKNMIAPIEKAILVANIGLTPSNNGEHIRLNIPPLTEERRKELVKQVKAELEKAKVAVRNVRREAMDDLKKGNKNGDFNDDEFHKLEDKVQKETDEGIKNLEKIADEKEKELLEG